METDNLHSALKVPGGPSSRWPKVKLSKFARSLHAVYNSFQVETSKTEALALVAPKDKNATLPDEMIAYV